MATKPLNAKYPKRTGWHAVLAAANRLLLFSKSDVVVVDGVRVFDASMDGTEEQEKRFVAHIRAAFALLREHDPVRCRRATRRLLHVVMKACLTNAQYDPDTRACEIDFSSFEASFDEGIDPDENAADFAVIIVHESTHAYLLDRGIPYTEDTELRVERVCVRQEHAFLRRLPAEEWEYNPQSEMIDAEISQSLQAHPEQFAAHKKRIWKQFRTLLGLKPK